MQTYHVFRKDQIVGKVELIQDGLYCAIHCSCALPQEQMYKLQLAADSQLINLGTMLPDGKQYRLSTRIAGKQLAGKKLIFHAIEPDDRLGEKYIVLCEDAPVPALEEIVTGRFIRRNGKPCVLLN